MSQRPQDEHLRWLKLVDFRAAIIGPISPPTLIWRTEQMNETLERLKAARRVMVRIVQAREDRAKFVPIIVELERQIAAQADLNEDLARIMGEAA